MLSLSLLFRRFLKLSATAYGGPAIAGQMKKQGAKKLQCTATPVEVVRPKA